RDQVLAHDLVRAAAAGGAGNAGRRFADEQIARLTIVSLKLLVIPVGERGGNRWQKTWRWSWIHWRRAEARGVGVDRDCRGNGIADPVGPGVDRESVRVRDLESYRAGRQPPAIGR